MRITTQHEENLDEIDAIDFDKNLIKIPITLQKQPRRHVAVNLDSSMEFNINLSEIQKSKILGKTNQV